MVSVSGTRIWFIGHGHKEGVKSGLIGSLGFTSGGWSSQTLSFPWPGLVRPHYTGIGVVLRDSAHKFCSVFLHVSPAPRRNFGMLAPNPWAVSAPFRALFLFGMSYYLSSGFLFPSQQYPDTFSLLAWPNGVAMVMPSCLLSMRRREYGMDIPAREGTNFPGFWIIEFL